ncbi:MAG: helix-turn-helix transcriptional regulator [Oscillospiraceae bacterium]|nr:helix-turn-helix transcriptional regulator [Oscillospiraceae bacterium]
MFKMSLRAARVNARLSRKDAANAINVSVTTLSNWENGETRIDACKFMKLCALYRCPAEAVSLPMKST